ncbi:MAG TPA: class I SAM-dependent methyltransferase [Gemmataceae bacterium]|jgi:SAM-dependent methyltransferase|nr:class I SAM-dependent methyltransferase [Gemmataceae bacterium]
MIPDWQLPPGTDRGLWDYVSSERVAREYDAALAGTPLLEIDLQFAARFFVTPGRLVDLGCGTGRLLVKFARCGFDCLGVDLSEAMLDVVREKAEQQALNVATLKANLVELDELPPSSFDYAACLFSTLGMIRGRDNRQCFLNHVRRILKPGGRFVLHAHNSGYRFFGRLGRPGTEPGDYTMPQHRGGADVTLHHFTRGKLIDDLTAAGFAVRECVPVSTRMNGRLRAPWFLPRLRAYGFLVAAE